MLSSPAQPPAENLHWKKKQKRVRESLKDITPNYLQLIDGFLLGFGKFSGGFSC